MEIEDTIHRKTYRDFDFVHLRHGKSAATRWHITQNISGMSRDFGFAPSENEAMLRVDILLKRRSEGRETQTPS